MVRLLQEAGTGVRAGSEHVGRRKIRCAIGENRRLLLPRRRPEVLRHPLSDDETFHQPSRVVCLQSVRQNRAGDCPVVEEASR